MRSIPYILGLAITLSSAFVEAGVDDVAGGKNAVIEPPRQTFHFESLAAWDSRYASEGRDNLNGANLGSLLLQLKYDAWTFGNWLALSDAVDYEERNFFAEYGFEWGELEGFLGYKFLQFPGEDNEDDNEFGAGLSGPELVFGLVPEIDWYYSVDSGGSYIELGLSREIVLTDQLRLDPSLTFGRNDGYVSDGHNGFDHARITLEAHYQINERMSIEAHLGRSIAIDPAPGVFSDDRNLKDFFHGGVGFSISF